MDKEKLVRSSEGFSPSSHPSSISDRCRQSLFLSLRFALPKPSLLFPPSLSVFGHCPYAPSIAPSTAPSPVRAHRPSHRPPHRPCRPPRAVPPLLSSVPGARHPAAVVHRITVTVEPWGTTDLRPYSSPLPRRLLCRTTADLNGIEFDTLAMEARLPPEKRAKAQGLVTKFAG